MVDKVVKLSVLQARVYFCIRRFGPIGPTKLGHRLNYEYDVASQNVTRPIRYLMKEGLVSQQKINERVVTYTAKHMVDPPFEIVGAMHEDFQDAN